MRLVDEDPLDADAALAGLVERAEDDPVRRVLEVGVLVDDAGGVAAELEHDLLLARPGLERPAHLGRAGEGEQLEPRVGGERRPRPRAATAGSRRRPAAGRSRPGSRR